MDGVSCRCHRVRESCGHVGGEPVDRTAHPDRGPHRARRARGVGPVPDLGGATCSLAVAGGQHGRGAGGLRRPLGVHRTFVVVCAGRLRGVSRGHRAHHAPAGDGRGSVLPRLSDAGGRRFRRVALVGDSWFGHVVRAVPRGSEPGVVLQSLRLRDRRRMARGAHRWSRDRRGCAYRQQRARVVVGGRNHFDR